MRFQVQFTLAIRSFDRKRAAFLSKKLTLPFVPFVGLQLVEPSGNSEPVISVAWSDETRTFHCHIDAIQAQMPQGCELDLDYLIESARENGWEGAAKIYDLAA
ncbi:hypothetical protein [Shewanella sp. FJAT-52076]|uniref:hypothetical protein n=1 Tax=Shewanella sp. FJAT-52076 TaxID=2864202 RepID=UPI001C65B920|nr:hypothetical protein [Shewanella sp. FJAT-52076]QYJ75024.1 hypothetical protein K0H79_17050 [Shewanella sp. FJAT-52076]